MFENHNDCLIIIWNWLFHDYLIMIICNYLALIIWTYFIIILIILIILIIWFIWLWKLWWLFDDYLNMIICNYLIMIICNYLIFIEVVESERCCAERCAGVSYGSIVGKLVFVTSLSRPGPATQVYTSVLPGIWTDS